MARPQRWVCLFRQLHQTCLQRPRIQLNYAPVSQKTNRTSLQAISSADFVQCRTLYTAPVLQKTKVKGSTKGNNNKANRDWTSGQVHLIGEDENDLGVMSKVKAKTMADEQELKMVLIDELSKPQVYQLMTSKQFIEEQKKQRHLKKAKKKKVPTVIRLASKITTHDLEIKVKHIIQMLEHGHEVKVFIKSTNATERKVMTGIFKAICDETKDHATVKKAKSKDVQEVVFTLQPLNVQEEHQGEHQSVRPLTLEELKEGTTSDDHKNS